MANISKDFFIYLSKNKLMNSAAKKWGLKLGAARVVAGIDIPTMAESVKRLNAQGMSCTVDHLGEFVFDRQEALEAKNHCINVLHKINEENLDCHVSIKLTQVGLDVDDEFCLSNMREIMDTAKGYNIFVNIDMEDYAHYDQTIDILIKLHEEYGNIGTVMQAYLFRTEDDLVRLKDLRLRLVKGAYKEAPSVAFQTKEEIDKNYIKLIKKRLLGDAFTSIATHDHHIINEVKKFVEEHNISKNSFEFQMLYGFRTDLQEKLVKEGYQFCTYVPFGKDWYGYFMRRLAERPQNLNFIVKDALLDSDGKVKKTPIVIGTAAASLLAWKIFRKK